ncbi:hypothetical protein TNIN_421281 [Trichonephila inaurata madagascariensis]|nr:hypothetical protein TNIN_421281 [Trichonephila inaurata madagascariensis]
MAFLEKAEKQDLILLAEDLGLKLFQKNALKGKKRIKSPGSTQSNSNETQTFELEKLHLESELHKLWFESGSIRSNVRRESFAEDPKKTSSNFGICIVRAKEHVRETSPAVLMAKATIPVPYQGRKGNVLFKGCSRQVQG